MTTQNIEAARQVLDAIDTQVTRAKRVHDAFIAENVTSPHWNPTKIELSVEHLQRKAHLEGALEEARRIQEAARRVLDALANEDAA